MPDLDEHVRSFERIRTPDLWREILEREPRPSPPHPGDRRSLAVIVALAVGVAGLGLAVRAFTSSPRPEPATTGVANGLIAYVRDGELWAVAPDGTDARRMATDLPGDALDPSWSPDGTRLVFVVQTDDRAREGGDFDLYVMNADGSNLTRITNDGLSVEPSWSPDGTKIAYARMYADGVNQSIWIMNADGSGAHPFTTCGPPECLGDSSPAWSPDGERIAFARISGAGAVVPVGIDVWPVDGSSNQPNISLAGASTVSDLGWSPDGTRIAFGSDLDGPGIYVMRADGSRIRRLTGDPDVHPLGLAWSPDGTRIVYSTSPQGDEGVVLFLLDPATGAFIGPEIGPAGAVCCPSWQPVAVGSTSESTSPEPSISPSVSAPIPVEPSPGAVSAIAYGFESAWVASYDGSEQGWLTRLDPRTGEAVARISTGDVHPTWEVGGGGLTAGAGSLWLAGAAPAPGEPSGVHAFLLRIDPTTNRVIAKIDLRATAPADVATFERGVWVMSFGLGERPTMQVSRIDPARDEVVATIPLHSWYGHHLFSVGGWIVASTNAGAPGEHGATPEGVLNVIDPRTESEVRTVPVGPSAWPAVGDGALWLATGDALERIDPSSGDVLARYEVTNTGDALGVGEGGIWFIGPEGRDVLRRFDPSLGAIDLSVTLPERATPIAMTTSPGAVWVLNYEGTVTRVSLT